MSDAVEIVTVYRKDGATMYLLKDYLEKGEEAKHIHRIRYDTKPIIGFPKEVTDFVNEN